MSVKQGGDGSRQLLCLMLCVLAVSVELGCGRLNRWLSPPLARAPQAVFTWTPEACPCESLVVRFNARKSTDEDGDIRSYVWDFGDGTNDDSNDPEPIHRYAVGGIYFVKLGVTDNDNLPSVVKRDIHVFE